MPGHIPRQIAYEQWDGLGTTSRDGAGRWVSPWVSPGFAFTELIPSWSARTPGRSRVEVEVRGRSGSRTPTGWTSLARWASHERGVKRTSPKDDPAVDTDTWRAPDGVDAWQLRVTLTDGASLDTVGAVVSEPIGEVPVTSEPGVACGVVLEVPRFSQMVHQGHYPEWGGGGEAWCSPTSTSMVLAYYDALPPARAWSWVPDGHPDPVVDLAARRTFDTAYGGTGNWPFNTAYAAPLAGHAFVTRLRDLREAEMFVAAGIPLVASLSWGRGELRGAPVRSSDGHLIVIRGFTESGDVVVNDPAARTNRTVRRTYDRAQLERAWLRSSGGTVYVIHDDAHPLPDEGDSRAW